MEKTGFSLLMASHDYTAVHRSSKSILHELTNGNGIMKQDLSKITTEGCCRTCKELKTVQYTINEQIKSYLKADETFKVTVNTVLSMASKACELFESSKIEQKRKLINYVFSSLKSEGATLRYSLKKPFDLMVDCN